uniref:Uncharacterized protein LOC100184227 n=1 Tax=Phallusia mammillata TaxID=59560 RepID=A0A6F9DHC5_9ASCI|nr:uncharacterized protein LOC100184227 [Phallusia mammillata]
MENATTEPVPMVYESMTWIIATSVGTLSLTATTWMLLVLCWYGIKHNKFSKSDHSSYLLYTTACTAAVLTFLLQALNEVAFNVGYSAGTDEVCNVITKLTVQVYVEATSFVYLFLWVKQYCLYQTSLLSHLYKDWIKRVSYLSIVLMVLGLNLAGITFNVLNTFGSTETGCRYVDYYYSWPSIAASSLNFVGDGIMLFLFFYPFRCSNQPIHSPATMRLLKRTAATTMLCVVTDAIAGMWNGLVLSTSNHISLAVYGFSATVNLLAVLLTFETWIKILTCPFHHRNISNT